MTGQTPPCVAATGGPFGRVLAEDPTHPANGLLRSIAHAELCFERQGARTILAQCHTTTPLRIGPPVPLDGCAYATIVNIAGGVVPGDLVDQRIDVGPGAHALVTTQSATKVYGNSDATSRSATRIRVRPGATIEWVPDPVIPFAGARYSQSLVVEIESGGTAIVAEAWAAGRVAQGEHWAAWLDSACRIDLQGTAVYRDHFLVRPEGAIHFEGWPYLATWVAVGDRPIEWERLASQAADVIEAREPRVYGGASAIGNGGLAARLAAASAPELADASNALWSELRRALLGVPRPSLRKY